jgi:chloramphenicol-sensitive protein RarD
MPAFAGMTGGYRARLKGVLNLDFLRVLAILMKVQPLKNPSGKSSAGAAYAAAAFLIWGISPIYWRELQAVPALEIVMHRVVWSPLILLPVLTWQHRWGELAATLKEPRAMLALLLTTLLISGNWLVFIWAINHEHVLETSIGYYITPLINVFLGMVFLGERLRPLQIAALALAILAVSYLAWDYGRFPWIALTLAFAFGFYSLVHKVVAISSITGLTLEMLVLSGPAVAYLFFLSGEGMGSFLKAGTEIDLLLVATSLFTAVPLLLFTRGTKRLHLSTLGFLQYIAPSCYLLLAVFVFNEQVSEAQILTFSLILLALCCYSTDSLLTYRWVVKSTANLEAHKH